MDIDRSRGTWMRLVACGLVAGAIINVIEWLAHRVWLYDQRAAAFAAYGKNPSYWTPFVIANFLVGMVSIWTYRWLASIYGQSAATALKAAAGMWIVFWVIPIAGLQPFGFFPNYLLAVVIIVGIADVALGILPAIRLYDHLNRSAAAAPHEN
jgi:hypothetical protein